MVDFLDIAPKAHTACVAVETADGSVEVELAGVQLGTLAEIAKRYPAFARVVEGGAGSVIEAAEAMPALIAAGLGHAGESEYEDKIRQFAASEIMNMAMTVMRLTFPASREVPDPLLPAADGAAGPAAISPLALNS
jgi:hypothetical protein